MDQRRVWIQRIHAELYPPRRGVTEGEIRSEQTRVWLAGDTVQLGAAARQRITVGYRMIDATDAEVLPLSRDLQRFGCRQPAFRALVQANYGIGALIAVAVWPSSGTADGSPVRCKWCVIPAWT